MSTTEATRRTLRLFLTRGIVAIALTAVFTAVSGSVMAGVSAGAAVLLVLYR